MGSHVVPDTVHPSQDEETALTLTRLRERGYRAVTVGPNRRARRAAKARQRASEREQPAKQR